MALVLAELWRSMPMLLLATIAVGVAADSIFGALVTALAISALILEIVLDRRQGPRPRRAG